MRLRVLIVSVIAFAGLAAACEGSVDAAPSSSPTVSASRAAAPEVGAFLSLCSVAADVAAEDFARAEATFEDEVHETVHELADRLETTDRLLAAALLRAKAEVEADFLDDVPDPATLGADVDGLLGAMGDALGTVDVEAPGCPEPPQ